MFKSLLLRIWSAMICAVMLLGVGVYTGDGFDVQTPGECVLNFAVLSDSHIEGNNYMRYRVYAKALQDVRHNRRGNDAVVFLGDNTMNGHRLENIFFHGTAAALLRGETVLTALGNHDIGNGQGDYATKLNRWYDFTRAFFGRDLSVPYYCEVIDGYCFIVLGTQAQTVNTMYLTDEQYAWLADVLAEAAESGKPAFVFSHHPIGAAADAEGYRDRRLRDMLADYSRQHDLFCFVGHTHRPMHLSESFYTDFGFAQTYLPCLTRLSGEKDRTATEDTGTGLMVELYADRIVLRTRDFFRSDWVRDTREEGDTLCEVTYELKNPIAG